MIPVFHFLLPWQQVQRLLQGNGSLAFSVFTERILFPIATVLFAHACSNRTHPMNCVSVRLKANGIFLWPLPENWAEKDSSRKHVLVD
jgi:hypothetical protein